MHVLKMLRHVRHAVEQRQAQRDKSSIWLPRYTSIPQWLTSGGDGDGMVLPESAREELQRGKALPGNKSRDKGDSTSDEILVKESKDEEDRPGHSASKKPTEEKERPKKRK